MRRTCENKAGQTGSSETGVWKPDSWRGQDGELPEAGVTGRAAPRGASCQAGKVDNGRQIMPLVVQR